MSDTTVSQVREAFEAWLKSIPFLDSELTLRRGNDGKYFYFENQWEGWQAAIATMQKELAECQLANKQMREAGKQFSHIIQMGSPSCQKRVVEQCKCTNCVSERFEALSLPSTTDTLDAYVSEAVKTALKGFNSDK